MSDAMMGRAMLQHGLIRVFDVFTEAEQARKALLAEGFDGDAVQLSVREDEAGPVEGNFTVGNEPTESDRHTYDRNYAGATQRGHCMITVAAGDPSQAAKAGEILARFGARDPDAPHGGH